MRVTRYATVRLLAAAVIAVLAVGGTTAAADAVGGGVGVGTFLLALVLGLVSFGVLAVLLLFDSRRRHQLMRALGSLASSDRVLVRHRRAAAEREPPDEQRAEMRRRLEYALEGLRPAVGSAPAAVGATSGVVLLEAGGRPSAGEGARRPSATTELPEAVGELDVPTEPPPAPGRLPVSARVAQGAPLVRVSAERYRQSLGVAAACNRLIGLRQDDDRWLRRSTASRWLVRGVALLLVPATLAYHVPGGSSWLGRIWDGAARRGALLFALALGVAGSVWTLVVTRPSDGRRNGPATQATSHSLRSLFASEQLAVRLAVGVAPLAAWQTVAHSNHFSPESVLPAAEVGEALALVEQLRRVARRRRSSPLRNRLAAIVRPVLTCLLPASIIILLL